MVEASVVLLSDQSGDEFYYDIIDDFRIYILYLKSFQYNFLYIPVLAFAISFRFLTNIYFLYN